MAGLSFSNNQIKLNNIAEYNCLFKEKFLNEFEKLCEKGDYILGSNVLEFEVKLAQYLKMNYCLGVGNGTNALEIAFSILELEYNDEVIIQANAYIASAFGALKSGGKLKIIDCDKNGLFDIDLCIKNITPQTKAVLVVHLYGDCCNMERLSKVCRENNIYLIEDCAQSLGTKYNEKMIGSFGDLSCHSFYPSKNLGALGDGGAICTNNVSFYNKCKLLRNLGSIKKYEHELISTNSRLDTLQASFLLLKLDDLNRCIEHKNAMAKLYDTKIALHIRNPDKMVLHSYHLYVILLDKMINRNEFSAYLEKNKIQSIVHYKVPFYKTKAFHSFNNLTFKNTEFLCNHILSLPIFNTIRKMDIEYINTIIKNYNIK
jgi:dTDP-4-amino-4,6-dideoxygalactose transaminase